jgi:hypothetical protein
LIHFADLFIDYDEFLAGMTEEQKEEENWESLDNEVVFEESEFEDFEAHRIEEIRDSFAKGTYMYSTCTLLAVKTLDYFILRLFIEIYIGLNQRICSRPGRSGSGRDDLKRAHGDWFAGT